MKNLLFFVIISFVMFSCGENEINQTKKYNPTPYEFTQEIPLRDFPLFIPADNALTNEGVKLGEELFNDKIMSIDNTLSCTSCHNPDKAFASNNQFDKGYQGKEMEHNTMSLVNLVFNKNFTWNGWHTSLEEAIIHTVENKDEFHEDWDNVVLKLKDNGYSDKFFSAFGTEDITAELTAKALAQYIRSNISVNSKFDRAYYFNDPNARFTPMESKGFELFLAESGDCFHCHRVGPFFDNRFHNNGLDISPQQGLEAVSKEASDRGKFKTTSLRNIAVTGPYMHDGRYNTLKEVLDFYSDHVNYSSTLDPNMNHEGGIYLTEDEKLALIAFLHTLTDDKYLEK